MSDGLNIPAVHDDEVRKRVIADSLPATQTAVDAGRSFYTESVSGFDRLDVALMLNDFSKVVMGVIALKQPKTLRILVTWEE